MSNRPIVVCTHAAFPAERTVNCRFPCVASESAVNARTDQTWLSCTRQRTVISPVGCTFSSNEDSPWMLRVQQMDHGSFRLIANHGSNRFWRCQYKGGGH